MGKQSMLLSGRGHPSLTCQGEVSFVDRLPRGTPGPLQLGWACPGLMLT